MWSEENNRITDFLVADSAEALGWIANSGAIPIHVWQSRVATIQNPDFTVVDLDPKGAPFSNVVELALALRRVCEAAGLPSYPKTSGSTGLHVLVPLGRQVTYEQSRMVAMLLSKVVLLELGEIGTTLRKVEARAGKVYLDTFQNGHGRLIVGAYSVRARPGAPVSCPLRWDEVHTGLDPDQHTIRTVIPRLRERGDPLLPCLTDVPDLVGAIDRLSQLLTR
jgi:bifunctional non-homologous end joining protein LigD